MMNEELAEYLLGLDKYIVHNDLNTINFEIRIQYPMNLNFILATPDDIDQSLLVNIKESEKKSLKISLHHQDNNTRHGLLRIDYNGRHLNPSEITPTLPAIFKPFAGKWLDNYSGHIHYVVNGYKPLAWAIPLEVDNFPIKKIKGREDYSATLKAFFHKINLKTIVTYNHQLKLL